MYSSIKQKIFNENEPHVELFHVSSISESIIIIGTVMFIKEFLN